MNVIHYTIAITLLEHEGKLKEIRRKPGNKDKPRWQIRVESRIQAIRKKLSYTTVLIECNKKQQFTKHQRSIKYRMEKQYGNVSTHKLQQIQLHLKQELRIESQKLKNRKVIRERRNINRMFKTSPKKVYRSMKGEVPNEIPTKEETTQFWRGLWENPVHHEKDTP